MKRSFFKKLTALALGTMFFISFSACNEGEKEEKAELNVWTASGMEKILRDLDYSSRYTDTTLEIGVFRNENEGGQIILSTDGTVDEYGITLNDLTLSGDPSVTLSKDCFEIYNQKYIYLERIKEQQIETAGGWYPDALLPWQTAVDYDENKIGDGKNQGIWINVKPEKEQQAGVYTGNFTITADEETVQVPVEVTVYNHTLSDTTHVKSSYGVHWDYVAMGELDATVEMQEAYYEYMLDHRVNTVTLPGQYTSMYIVDDEFIPYFLQRAHQAAEEVRCNFYCMPYKAKTITVDGVEITTLDFDFMLELMQEMAKYSVENDVDLFEKMDIYPVFLDEFDPSQAYKQRNASYTLDKYWTIIHGLTAETLFALVEGEIDEQTKETLLASAKGVHPFIPAEAPAEKLDIENYPNAKLIPCNTIGYMDQPEKRDYYEEYIQSAYGEQWWYQATSQYPHVSYQIETPVVSPRFNGWMMYDYDIVGDLYWECSINHQFTQSYEIEYTQTQFDISMRYPGHTGDGKLLYAGREYGVYGPIGTIRMEAIRDSHEDYDLLYELEELYATRGVTGDEFNSIFQFLVDGLYSNTSLLNPTNQAASISILQNAREMLATLYDLYYENGVVVHSYQETKGVGTLVLSATDDTVVKLNGEVIGGESENGVATYVCTTDLNKDTNVFEISATTNGAANSIAFDFGGKKSVIDLGELADKYVVQTNKTTQEDSAIVEKDTATGCFKVTTLDDVDAVIRLEVSELAINSDYDSVTVRVYVYDEAGVSLTLRCKCANERGSRPIMTYSLKAGWNEINLDVVNELKCDKNGALDYLQFEAAAGCASFGLGEIIVEG